MWLALRHVRATLPIYCRVAATHPLTRAASTLTPNLLRTSTPVAEKLAETELWSLQSRRAGAKKQKTKTKAKAKTSSRSKAKAAQNQTPTGDKSRVNIVSEKLCDDIVKYIGPTLKRHVGCDLLDINPGAGVWSKALNDVLQPRSHILMEPDAEFYRPFLEPLLSKPTTRLVPHSGILWDELQTAMGYLEHQVEQARSSPSDDPQRNDTLLVTANLSYFPKRRFRNFDSIAVLVLYQLLTSVRFGSLFQKYGLVRMLIWVNDDDKRTFLPRCLQNRKKSALQAEFACEWLAEVAGKDPASLQVTPEQLRKLYLRDRWINVDSTREALARAKANGIGLPPAHRRMELTDEVIKRYRGRTKSAAEAAQVRASYIERPYMAELEALDRGVAAGELNAEENPKEWARRAALRAQATKQEKWTARFQELLQELAELTRLRASGTLTDEELAAREAEYNQQVQDLGKNPLIDFRLLRDNAHVYQQTPPVLLWDRRPWEPLRVAEDEFFPNVEAALLDVQPKVMHRLLREAGPGSTRAGDMFDLIQRSILTNSLEPVSTSLEKLWPGAREGILERCPSLWDPARGGLPGNGHAGVCARVLNETQWMEILEAFMAWPFRPTYAELIGRHGDDLETPEPERHGPELM